MILCIPYLYKFSRNLKFEHDFRAPRINSFLKPSFHLFLSASFLGVIFGNFRHFSFSVRMCAKFYTNKVRNILKCIAKYGTFPLLADLFGLPML